jgi:regulator of nucleoside diphosphate kinase
MFRVSSTGDSVAGRVFQLGQRLAGKCVSHIMYDHSASGPQVALGSSSVFSDTLSNCRLRSKEMPKRKIVITRNDYEYLKELLSSGFTQAISPSDFLESLEAELELAEIVDPERVPKNVVTMNSTVKLRDLDTNELETYTLVFPDEADIANYKLSVLAPVGTAILGQRVGDVLRWRVPDGWRRLKVVRVLYQPERAGVFHA